MRADFEIGVFKLDKTTRGLYVLEPHQLFSFDFLRVNQSKSEILKNKGVHLVVQSFSKTSAKDRIKTKVLHSGLLRVTSFKDCHFGDNISLKQNRKDFFILDRKENDTLIMYYFKNRKPRNKHKFIETFLKSITNV